MQPSFHIRNVHPGQARTAIKRVIADGINAGRNGNIGQACTFVESIRTNVLRVGNHNRLERCGNVVGVIIITISAKEIPQMHIIRCAFLCFTDKRQGQLGQACTSIEYIFANALNCIGNDNFFHLNTIVQHVIRNQFTAKNDLFKMVKIHKLIICRSVGSIVIYRVQIFCLIEDLRADRIHRFGNGDFGNSRTSVKGSFANGFHRHGDLNACYVRAIGKCSCANCSNSIAVDLCTDANIGIRTIANTGHRAGFTVVIYCIRQAK